jgi:hypothetical protein
LQQIYADGGTPKLRNWVVVAADRRGAQWTFLVQAGRRPSQIEIAKQIKEHGRIVELSGQMIDSNSIDLSSVRVAGDESLTPRVRGGATRYSIEGDALD